MAHNIKGSIMRILSSNRLLTLVVSVLLAACTTTTTQQPQQTVASAAKATASLTPVALTAPAVMPDTALAQQTCSQLKAQFQTQLPYQILNQLQWQATVSRNPLTPNAPLAAVCRIHMSSTGLILLTQGLTANFMSATLERLNWAGNSQTDAYTADSSIGHQEALVNGTQLAVINYTFQPPAKACPSNQPIAACKYPKKKWLYELNTWVF
ncbi:MAG: hypothetical protein K0S08_210 [Gammaproteobacteria bacterium]|jgi:hypothetical protein|nr:hypothetical protein [Gammaproteobacteria bacterium]